MGKKRSKAQKQKRKERKRLARQAGGTQLDTNNEGMTILDSNTNIYGEARGMSAIAKNQINKTSTEETLKEYYGKKYGTPKNGVEAIELLTSIFKDLMDMPELTLEVSEGIGEYFRILENRGLPGYEWMLEAFHVTAKKSYEKRNFNYVVGMLRQWMKWGFGHIPSQQEEDIVDYFEEVISEEVNPEARSVIHNLMGTFGAIKVTRMIGKIEKEINLPYIKALLLKDLMEEKFGTTVK